MKKVLFIAAAVAFLTACEGNEGVVAPDRTQRVVMNPVGNSSVTGVSTVAAGTEGLAGVIVNLRGLVRGARYTGSIQRGTCAQAGTVVRNLTAIVADTLGMGGSHVSVADSIAQAGFSIRYNAPAATGTTTPGPVTTCGDIPNPIR